MVQRAIDIVASALTTVLLAFGLFGSGLVVCMMPQTTQLLGNNFYWLGTKRPIRKTP